MFHCLLQQLNYEARVEITETAWNWKNNHQQNFYRDVPCFKTFSFISLKI